MVTHYEVSEADVRKAIHAFDDIMEPYVEDLRVRKLEQEAAAAAAASEAAVAAAAGQSMHSPLSLSCRLPLLPLRLPPRKHTSDTPYDFCPSGIVQLPR
jgi:hypothetical protein